MTAYQLLISLALVMTVILFIGTTLIIRSLLQKGTERTTPKTLFVLKGIVLSSLAVLLFELSLFSQFEAITPPILNEKGEILKGSIATLTRLEINGRREWISIRGVSEKNPVLLFLAGGPGGSQMAAVRHELAELEKHFIVVNWDQPGSCKSYSSAKNDNLTKDIYVADGIALTEYLCKRFNQEKIYIVGESWGSALAIFLAAEAPERYHAIIGTGQMIAFLETERIDYEKALEIATKNGDTKKQSRLVANGSPPYYGSDVTWKSAEYLNYLTANMMKNPEIHNSGYNTFRDIFSPEYGYIDKINFFRGIIKTFNYVYPQLYDMDLRADYPILDVPVYFFLGRHDLNAPPHLVENYYSILKAPHKKIIWFEHSGHSPWINESEQFVEEVLRVTSSNHTK